MWKPTPKYISKEKLSFPTVDQSNQEQSSNQRGKNTVRLFLKLKGINNVIQASLAAAAITQVLASFSDANSDDGENISPRLVEIGPSDDIRGAIVEVSAQDAAAVKALCETLEVVAFVRTMTGP